MPDPRAQGVPSGTVTLMLFASWELATDLGTESAPGDGTLLAARLRADQVPV